MMDTFGSYSVLDTGADPEEREIRRQRLVREDRALRPWLIGKALRGFRYTRMERIKLLVKEAVEAARWSWRMSA